jgi:hypothetical protein
MIRDLMTGGASVEDTLTLWASSLRDAKQRIGPLFRQERVAASAGQFLDGLLRKTGWMRAEAAGDPGPWRQQAILGRGQWDADALRDIVREYAGRCTTMTLDVGEFIRRFLIHLPSHPPLRPVRQAQRARSRCRADRKKIHEADARIFSPEAVTPATSIDEESQQPDDPKKE